MLSASERLTWQVGILVVLLGAWQICAMVGWIDPFFFPDPVSILTRVVEWLIDGEIYKDFAITLFETVAGFFIGTFLGVSAGIFLGLRPRASQIVDPFIKVLNAVPRVVLAPLFILWLGLGVWSKIALAVTLVFFITFFNAYQGIKEVNPLVLNNVRILGASPHQLLRHVYLPSSASWILSSLRVSVGFALIGAIIGEYLGSSAGLGHVIAQAEGVFDSTGVFAGIVLLSTFVLLLDRLLDMAERRLIVWRPKPAAEAAT